MTVQRSLVPGAFDVRDGTCVVGDELLPIVVEFDITSGSPGKVYTWRLLPELRTKRVVNAVALLSEKIVVASPACGGLVVIDRSSGEAEVVELDGEAGQLFPDENVVWVFGAPDDDKDVDEGEVAIDDPRRRPVLWQIPTRQDIEHYYSAFTGPGWRIVSPQIEIKDVETAMAEAEDALKELRAEDGDTEIGSPPRPLWRYEDGVASRVGFDAEWMGAIVRGGRRYLIACRLPIDPIVKSLSPGDRPSVRYSYPASLVVGDLVGPMKRVADLQHLAGEITVDDGRTWLSGFGLGVVEFDWGTEELLEALPLSLVFPSAVVASHVVDLGVVYQPAGTWLVRCLTLNGAEVGELDLKRGRPWNVKTNPCDGKLWMLVPRDAVVISLDPVAGQYNELALAFDCGPHMPVPSPPEGTDTAEVEAGALAEIRDELLDPLHQEEGGEPEARRREVRYHSVDLEGEFPQADVVVTFTLADQPSIRFGRRWPVWDELGNPNEWEYGVGIYVDEDLLSGEGWRKFEGFEQGGNGIVWI